MKFTFNWLRDHLETTTSLGEIVDRLSIIGLEVESVEEPAKALSPFVVARVVDAKQHPNADKLRVCQVDTGSGVVEVVCGAPNARAGMIGVFAPLGSYIPGTGITLDKRPVRGVVSNGMLVSERELQLSEDHEGIIDLGEDHAKDVGKRYVDVMGLDDPVVPPKQAQVLIDDMLARKLPVAYEFYSGESHGFRIKENLVRSLEEELYFYGEMMGFSPAGRLATPEIHNPPLGAP